MKKIKFILPLFAALLAVGCSGKAGEKGADGAPGAAGSQGAPGTNGTDGKDGKDFPGDLVNPGYVAHNTEWYEGVYEKSTTVRAFGWAHQATLGFAEITTDENGKIKDIVIDEIFNLSQWTKLSAAGVTALGADNVLTIGTNNWIKYIKIGDTFYVAQGVASATGVPNLSDTLKADSANVRYFPLTKGDASPTDLSAWTVGAKSIDTLMVENATKELPDLTLANAYLAFAKVTKSNFSKTSSFTAGGLKAYKKDASTALDVSKSASESATTTKYAAGATGTGAQNSMFKLESGYGPANPGGYTQGIAGTFKRCISFIKNYGIDFDLDSLVKNGYNAIEVGHALFTAEIVDEDGISVLVNTGSTANDTKNYLTLLVNAGKRLEVVSGVLADIEALNLPSEITEANIAANYFKVAEAKTLYAKLSESEQVADITELIADLEEDIEGLVEAEITVAGAAVAGNHITADNYKISVTVAFKTDGTILAIGVNNTLANMASRDTERNIWKSNADSVLAAFIGKDTDYFLNVTAEDWKGVNNAEGIKAILTGHFSGIVIPTGATQTVQNLVSSLIAACQAFEDLAD